MGNKDQYLDIRLISSRPRNIIVPTYFFNGSLKPVELAVYMQLFTYATNFEKCYPTMEQIADGACVSRRTVIEAIKELKKRGLVSVEKNKTEKGKFANNVYTVYDDEHLFQTQKKALANTDQSNKQEPSADLNTQQNIELSNKNNSMTPDKMQDEICATVEAEQEAQEVINLTDGKLTQKEAESILKAANNDVAAIKEKYELSKTQNVNNLGAWLYTALRNGYIATPAPAAKKESSKKFNSQHDFPQRGYTKDDIFSLEQQIIANQSN